MWPDGNLGYRGLGGMGKEGGCDEIYRFRPGINLIWMLVRVRVRLQSILITFLLGNKSGCQLTSPRPNFHHVFRTCVTGRPHLSL